MKDHRGRPYRIHTETTGFQVMYQPFDGGLWSRLRGPEGRPLVLVVRETPLHRGHLRLMDLAARAGAVIFPPVPAFYQRPATLDEMIDQTVARVLQRLGVSDAGVRPWKGL